MASGGQAGSGGAGNTRRVHGSRSPARGVDATSFGRMRRTHETVRGRPVVTGRSAAEPREQERADLGRDVMAVAVDDVEQILGRDPRDPGDHAVIDAAGMSSPHAIAISGPTSPR